VELLPQLDEQRRGVNDEPEELKKRKGCSISSIFYYIINCLILAIPLAFTIEGFHGRCLGFYSFGAIYTAWVDLQGTCCFLGFGTCNLPASYQKKIH
jgi:hypothetical protein